MNDDLNRYCPPFLLYALIFYLSSRPASGFPDIMPDMVPHFVEYFFLSFFFIRMFCFRSPVDAQALMASAPALLVLAVLDEVHQYYVPSRHFEVKDILVDAAGIGAGILVFALLRNSSRLKIKTGKK
ncbi:MAG: VanZ family protein [bacterium]|nr:VanZ family protein [bacterium]